MATRLEEAERLLRDLRASTAQDIDLIEEWCAEEGKPHVDAARPGIEATRALHAAVDAFLSQAPATGESELVEDCAWCGWQRTRKQATS